MFSKIKKWLAYVLVVVCFGSFFYKAATTGRSSEEIVMSFWGTNLPFQYALEHVAEEYNASQNQYKVVIDKQDASNYRTWMGARLAGGNASDLLMTTNVYANTDASNGYLCDLSEYLKQPNPYNDSGVAWSEDFSGTYLTQVAYAADTSKYYCIPTDTVSVRIMINTELLTEYGIEIPDETWTFSDFRKICEKLEEKGYTAMEIANAKFINYMVSWIIDIMMNQLKHDDIDRWDVNGNMQVETEEIVRTFLGENPYDISQDTAFKETMQFLKAWSKWWGAGFNSRGDASENFLRQTIPMLFSGSWGVSGVELTLSNENPEADKTNPYKPFSYISLPFPRLEKEVYLSKDESFTFTTLTHEDLPLQELGEPSGCICIPKATEENGKLDGALDFLRYYTSAKTSAYMANASYSIPITKNVEVNEKMQDFLPPEHSESVRMRFNLLNLSDGVAEEYHFKQVQMYLMTDSSAISLATLCKNIQSKYIEVSSLLKEDNGWEW